MKAIVISAPGQVDVVDQPEPTLGPEDVLINVHYVGLCGSDLGTYRGSFQLVSYPRVPGHEIGGTIAATGDRVPDSLRTGQAVTVSPYTACGVCASCRVGRTNACRFNETLGVQRDGALCERFTIHFSKVLASDELTSQELALVEPMGVGYHAANRGAISEVDTVLAIGCGTIGIGVVAAAARKGAAVIAVDVDEAKLALARRFGAQQTINSSQEDVLDGVLRLTANEGVRVAVEAVGLPQTYRLATQAACYAGRVVYVGYAKDHVCYDTTDFVRKELDIRGSRNALRVMPAVIRMMEAREQPFADLITATYPLTQTAQAFADWNAEPATVNKILIDVMA
jgi:threonine dehydrogenase-like Zn-dependent dehydrogenase